MVEICPISNAEESFKKFVDPDPDTDDFQNNIIGFSVSRDTSQVKFS